MPLVTNITQSSNALSPYAINERKGPKDERRHRRDRRKSVPAYQLKTSRKNTLKTKDLDPIKPSDAHTALREIEKGMQLDPDAASKSQAPNPGNVRVALRGSSTV